MDTKRLHQLAKLLDDLDPDLFDQGKWAHPCGMPACIGGYACALFAAGVYRGEVVDDIPVHRLRLPHFLNVESKAQDLLGLSDGQSAWLFAGRPRWGDERDGPVHPRVAAAAVRWLVECDQRGKLDRNGVPLHDLVWLAMGEILENHRYKAATS